MDNRLMDDMFQALADCNRRGTQERIDICKTEVTQHYQRQIIDMAKCDQMAQKEIDNGRDPKGEYISDQ